MSEDIYTFPIPENVAKMLVGMVELARKDGTLTLTYNRIASSKVIGPFDYIIQAGSSTKVYEAIYGRVLESLEAIDLILLLPSNQVLLTADAYKWADYQFKSRLGKFLARKPNLARDIWLGIVSLVTFALVVVQIVEVVNSLASSS